MSMDVCLRLFLVSLLAASTRAGPLSTASSASLTPYLAGNVPTCAQPCLQSFVADSFPSWVCSSPSLNCLCTSDSGSGYTLGEGALSCLAADCPNWDQDEALTVYGVCSNVVGAMPNTHAVITATYTAVTTVSEAPSTRTASRTSHHSSVSCASSWCSSSSSASASTSNMKSAIITATSSPSSSTTPPPSSPTAAAPAAASSSQPPTPILTKPQIAGVVVASIAAAALAFGLCFLLFCYRRRNQHGRHSYSSFGGDKAMGSSVDSSPDMATIAARDFGHDPEGKEVVAQNRAQSPPRLSVATPQTTGESGWNQWRRNTAPQDIGLALAPGAPTTGNPSPITPTSYRTRNSQLLPEKPSYSLFPAPLRPSPHSRRASQSLEAQLAVRSAGKKPSPPNPSQFRFPGSLDTSQTNMQGDSSSRSPSSPPQIFPFMHGAQGQSSYRPYRQQQEEQLQSAMLGPHWTPTPGVLPRRPLPAHASPSARGLRLGQSIHNGRSSLSAPFFPPPPPTDPHYLAATLHNAGNTGPRRKRSDPRTETWFSNNSETSFEGSSVADADDFPEPVSALTPVKEHSPITYPRIPTTAAESPTRRPPTADQSQSSLLFRRQGDEGASESPDGNNSHPAPQEVHRSAISRVLQSPTLSEPLATSSSSSNSSPRMGRRAGMAPPPSGWPARK